MSCQDRARRPGWLSAAAHSKASDTALAPIGQTRKRDGQGRVGAAALLASLLVGAYLMAVAVSRPDHSWLAWTSLLPLLVAIRILAPVKAMACGALWGLSLYVLSVGGGVVASTSGSLILLTTVPAIYAYLGGRLTRRFGFSPFLLALGWMGVEFALRPLGLDRGLLAGTQGDGALVRLVGGLLGYVFVAFLVAYANALLLSAVSDVRLEIPQARLPVRVDELRGSLLPQTFASFPFFGVRRRQPRGPPIPAAATSKEAAGLAGLTDCSQPAGLLTQNRPAEAGRRMSVSLVRSRESAHIAVKGKAGRFHAIRINECCRFWSCQPCAGFLDQQGRGAVVR
jgi:hypothetical protein